MTLPIETPETMASATGRERSHDPSDFDTFTEAIRADRTAIVAALEADAAHADERAGDMRTDVSLRAYHQGSRDALRALAARLGGDK